MTETRLHGFFRSTASWRVRIVLALKGIAHDGSYYRLRAGDQRGEGYLALNPQGLVPALEIDGAVLTQSLAICEYLNETRPEPALLPADPVRRAKVRAAAQVIACDIHPIQNLKILKRLSKLGHDQAQIDAWAREVIEEGFEALNRLLADEPGPFAFGDSVTLADVCIVPQMGNARRFGVDLNRWPRLLEIEQACLQLDAFAGAQPQNQPDAE